MPSYIKETIFSDKPVKGINMTLSQDQRIDNIIELDKYKYQKSKIKDPNTLYLIINYEESFYQKIINFLHKLTKDK